VASACALAAALALAPAAGAYVPPPVNAQFDYQIGGDYPLPDGVGVVARDWFAGAPAADPVYSICYVNAYQTQADEKGADRPDEQSNWPKKLVLTRLGDDPKWGGEYLIDISTASKRGQAVDWIGQMLDGCAEKGFDAVEYDNLDSWTRFNGTPLADDIPFGKPEALEFAALLAEQAQLRDLAVAQKNTVEIKRREARKIGFDFAIAEECGRYNECNAYRKVYGDNVIAIEYRKADFKKACKVVGDDVSVVYRDRQVSKPGSKAYIYDSC